MAENFVNILREIRGNTLAPATDKNCIYGDIKWMYGVISGYQQITPAERLKLENIEEEATKNSSDGFLLARENHTGNMSIANVQDTPSRMAMTIHEKNKLEAINVNATVNDTDANLRNRATHTGTQSIDTITDTSTHVKMSVAERGKLSGIAVGATKNATDAELRSRSTHTGTQSADSIVDGLVNAAFTNVEKIKLAALDTTKLEAQNDASKINYSGTSSGLIATKVQGAIDEVENRLEVAETVISNVNLKRADKYLASQNIAKMIYDLEGNLLKVRYNNDVDVDYEVLTYSGENLVNLAHYVNKELKGNTVMTYASDELVSSIFIGSINGRSKLCKS